MRPQIFYRQLANPKLARDPCFCFFWQREQVQAFVKSVRNAGMYFDSNFATPSLSFQDAG